MRSALLGLLLILPILSGVAVAHEPDTFTVIVREDRHDPAEVNLIVNDTVQYYNVDSRENVTHIIGLDLNGDNDFDDEGEFSSGVLHSECDWDNDTDCRVAWIFVINDTALVGNYILSDLRSDGTEIEVRLNIGEDIHPTSLPEIGECFGDCEEEEEETQMKRSSQTDLQKAMMLAGMTMFGGASVLLLAMIMQRS
ncbi:MAG: hypothetical protein CMB52_02610 [Euryarchaeota archaeon]|mgnify:CR=1 FL=1|nr:hypothetical protein [Euryarchaeota archaeon]|tara:strand:+ start:737 stop:1324 length:588 start_codon:yes stop_codon:yes gene_type:complete